MAKKTILLIAAFLAGCSSDEPDKRRPSYDAIEQAVRAKLKIKTTEERVFYSLSKIEQLTNEYDPRDLKTEELLIDQYRDKHLPMMREWGSRLIGAKKKFVIDWNLHITAVNEAPEIFRDCKNKYLMWAESQEDDEFGAMYKDMADASESWAQAMENRSVTLTKMHEEFVRKTKFIDDSVEFLGRLESFLKTIPDAGRAAELQQFMEEVDKYIESFHRTIKSFKNFSDKLKSDDYSEAKELS